MRKIYIIGFVALLLMSFTTTVMATEGYIQFNHSNIIGGQMGQPVHLVVQYGNPGSEALEHARVRCQFLGGSPENDNVAFSNRSTAHGFNANITPNGRFFTTETFTINPGQNYNIQLVVIPQDYDDIRIRCRLQQDFGSGPIVQVDGTQIRIEIH